MSQSQIGRSRAVVSGLRLQGAPLVVSLLWLATGCAALSGVSASLLSATSIALATVTVSVDYRRSDGDLFAPGVFLFGYLAFVMLSPWAYLVIFQRPIQIISVDTVHGPVVAAMVLTVSGWGFATMLLRALPIPAVTTTRRASPAVRGVLEEESFKSEFAGRLRLWGWLTLLGTAALRVFLVVESLGQVYGAGQFVYNLGAALTPVADVTLILAVVFFVAAVMVDRGPVLSRGAAVTFVLLALLSMFGLGTRGELIAPAIVFLWCAWRLGKIGFRHVAGVGVATVLLFFAVAKLRSATTESLLERTMADISSPYLVTEWLTRYVPEKTDFLLGETYFATIPMLLPGPLARLLSGGDIGTGSFRFREVVGFNDPNHGFGFAMPAEAYLNFGLPGVFIIMAIAGCLVALAHRRWVLMTGGAKGAMYALIIGAMPFALRADALAQTKSIIFPVVIVAVILAVESRAARRVAARAGAMQRRVLRIAHCEPAR